MTARLRRPRLGLAAALTIAVLAAAPVAHAQQTFTYSDFSDLSDWQLNAQTATYGNPIDVGGHDVLRLTNATTGQAGSAFLTNAISLANQASFSATFSFQMTDGGGLADADGPPAGADGLVFVVQTNSNTAGTGGAGIGYDGIANSVGVEFDTWDNGAQDGNNGNHVGINTEGNASSIALANIGTPFNDGNIWYAWVDYDGVNQTMEVRVSQAAQRPATATLTQTNLDLVTILGATDAYVGFTSGTGAAYNNHDVRSFTFTNDFEPIDNCTDSALDPAWDGSIVGAGVDPYLPISVDRGLSAFQVYNAANVQVLGLYDAPSTIGTNHLNAFDDFTTGCADTNGDCYRYELTAGQTPPSGDLYVRVAPISGSNSNAFFFLRLTDTCPMTVDLDPVLTAETTDVLPSAVTLDAAYPNPFNPSTRVAFTLPEAQAVRLAVYDVLGRRVAVLVDGVVAAGRHAAVWSGADDAGRAVPSGTYLVRLDAGGASHSRTLTLLK